MRRRIFGHTGVGWGVRAVDRVLVMNRGCQQLLMVSLVMWEECGMWVAVGCLVFGVSGASWVVGAYPVDVLELWVVVLSHAEQGFRSTMTNTSLMTWQFTWVHGALLWAQGSRQWEAVRCGRGPGPLLGYTALLRLDH